MGQKWDKFLLLMWKNWLLQYRRPIQTVIEIVAPVLFSIILVIIRNVVDPEPHDSVVYSPFCTIPFINITGICEAVIPNNSTSAVRQAIKKLNNIGGNSRIASNFSQYTLMYSPVTPATQAVMDYFNNLPKVLENAEVFENETEFLFGNITGFNNSEAMLAYYMTNGRNTTFAGIQFDDSLVNTPHDLGPDKNVKFSIRFPGELRMGGDILGVNNWRTNLIYPIFQTAGPRNPTSQTGADPNYYNEGFLALQHLLSIFITMYNTGIREPSDWLTKYVKFPFIYMRRFPNAAWQEDLLLTPLKSFVSLFVMLSFTYTCTNTVKAITAEKEKQLKEAMKIMGLPNWLHWVAWFVKTFSYLMVSIILMVVLLKVKWYKNTEFTVFTYANPVVLLMFMFFYICATITFCFAISVFFSKANTAATIAGLAWFLSYSPFSFLQNSYDTLSLSTKVLSSLGSNTAMAFGFQIILMYEGTGEGIQFSNIWTPNTQDDTLSLGIIMAMLVLDAILYLLIALYVEAIFPGDYGVPQKWYFPFTSSFWCGQPRVSGMDNFDDELPNKGEFYEAEPKQLKAGVRIRNLKKVFGHNTAVRNFSLNMYEDQITVLLGHNGAGKTTTMSMLTGMFPPTSGTAFVSGYDIRSKMDAVRNSLGLCPQHNVIFDDLTVAEHIYFFSRLKGLKGKDIDGEITKYLDLLELQPKKNAKSSTLSGGMKRKLCVGVALCGNSKVVMLDEPTAGMDPSARRALWDLLLAQKTGRTILLTTHFMDEADLLGDRIAIMAAGQLQCCGSSFFLKKKYGAGYHLIMDKSQLCNPERVTRLLRKHIPNIEIHSNIGSELTYLLAESQSYVFETMLKDLEEHSEELYINSYGISLTTLEEVFMKVGADHGQEELYNVNENGIEKNGNIPAVQETKVELHSPPPSVSTMGLIGNQIRAMSMKKILSTYRSWILLVIQVLMPVIFLVIAMAVAKQRNRSTDLPPMPLSLDKYKNPVVLVDGIGNDVGYAEKYKSVVGSAYKEDDSIQERILEMTKETPVTVRRRYIGGASFSKLDSSIENLEINPFDVNFTVYFNNDPYHTPGVSLNLALNTMYRKVFNRTNVTLEVTNHPLPYSAETKVNQMISANGMGFQLGFNISFSMAFVSSFYILFIVRERVSKSKHLQFVSGVNVYIFWLTTLFWDFITYLITVIFLLLTVVSFREDGFKTFQDIERLSFILICFGWSMLPMMYIAGFFFDIPSTGYTRMTLFSVFTGCAAFLIVQVLTTPGLNLEDVGNTLHWVFLIIPHYSLGTGIRDTYTLYFYNQLCNKYYEICHENYPNYTNQECLDYIRQPNLKPYCEGLDEDYFKWKSPGIGRNLVFSLSGGLIMLIILLLTEFRVFSKIGYCIERNFPSEPKEVENEDSDVQTEKIKIKNASQAELEQEYTMVLKDLTKYYKKFLAVNGLCLGVKHSECFGLLGINGAGKTTTFKMLTGDVKMSYGDAWVNGHNIRNQIKKVQKSIGYCPQFDALLDDLTARESLIMFCLLRGIPYKFCNKIAEKLAIDFDYRRHLDKKVKELSGGNKRKLSTSIALIGDPPVMYLDEPTTGMDPATKRHLWNALCQVRDNGKTIILTSHSMEECEALCTRLAIMVNGNFKCLGSTQHLKNKYAEGYTLTIKVKKPADSSAHMHTATEPIEEFIREKFPSAAIREKHEELMTYYITDKSVPWSQMFGVLEEAKRKDLNIEDYSLGQSSLEQVFLTFTKHQHDL